MIAHFDCNAFYVSVELSFRPDLAGCPAVVANCNEADGGIILALNDEAKQLGLKRGNPVFQVKEQLNKHHVAVFGANLPKYVEMSRRITQIVKDTEIPETFIPYSIDEFFCVIPVDDPASLRRYMAQIKDAIMRGTGIPVSCGASSTYTLAKAATHFAKHYNGYRGICIITPDKKEAALQKLKIEDVWGIGRASIAKLSHYGIQTAYDLILKKESFVRRLCALGGAKTWKELQGIPCIDLSLPAQQLSMSHTRTFTYMVVSLEELKTYVASYCAPVALKLRAQKSVCAQVWVMLKTNRHRPDLPQYNPATCAVLTTPVNDTLKITQIALQLLEKIYQPGFQYKVAGVTLTQISSDEGVQLDLFEDPARSTEKMSRLMQSLDRLNAKFGPDKVHLAIQAAPKKLVQIDGFQPVQNQTTQLDDIITVK